MTLNTSILPVLQQIKRYLWCSKIEEILSLSENPKQPSTTNYLNEDQTKLEKAQEIKYSQNLQALEI